MDPRALLADLIRIDTSNPPGNEAPAAERLEAELAAAGLETQLFTSPAGRVSLVGRVDGDRRRSALVLLSHLDVVPVEPERWSRAPFEGVEAEGCLWGRGALDMKGVLAMHAAAARAAAPEARREIVVVAVADEEAGGDEGAGWLLEAHPDAVGFAAERPAPEVLGEGAFGVSGILDRPLLAIAVGEKTALGVAVTAAGEPGHGSLPPRSQAILGLARFLDEVSGYGAPRLHPVVREQMAAMALASSGVRRRALEALASRAGPVAVRGVAPLLRSQPALAAVLSDVVTPTMMWAGYKGNVVPGEAGAKLDCRLLPDTDPDDFLARLRRAGAPGAVTVEERSRRGSPVSGRGALYDLLERASRSLPGAPVPTPTISPGITDLRHFRRRGAAAYGWVPLVLTPELLATIHGHDERIPLDGFERACAAMTEVVREAAR